MRFRSQLTEAMARQARRQLSPPRPSPLRKLSVGCIDLAAVVTCEQKSRLWTHYFVCLECAIVYIVLFHVCGCASRVAISITTQGPHG